MSLEHNVNNVFFFLKLIFLTENLPRNIISNVILDFREKF